MNLGCPGSDRVERGYQPRLIALSIVPNYLKISKNNGEQLNILQTVV